MILEQSHWNKTCLTWICEHDSKVEVWVFLIRDSTEQFSSMRLRKTKETNNYMEMKNLNSMSSPVISDIIITRKNLFILNAQVVILVLTDGFCCFPDKNMSWLITQNKFRKRNN